MERGLGAGGIQNGGFPPPKVSMRATARHIRNNQVDLQVRTHHLLTDHPLEFGGQDTGATPAELLISALASCTAVNVAQYAARKGYPLESVEVQTGFALGRERVDGPVRTRTFLSDIDAIVDLRGPLTQQQFLDLKYCAEHCAIGETLRQGVEIHELVQLVTD